MKKKFIVMLSVILAVCTVSNIFSNTNDIDASFRKIYSISYAYPEGLSGGQNIRLNAVDNLPSYGTAQNVQNKPATEKYGYAYIKAKSEAQALFYDVLLQEANSVQAATFDVGEVDVGYMLQTYDLRDYSLTIDEAVKVWVTLRNDHPEFYWLSNECMTSNSDNAFCMLVYEEYATAQSRKECNDVIDSAVSEYISLANNYGTKLEMALAVHDELCKAVTYAMDNGAPSDAAYAHNLMGVFANKAAVCEGYAKAYQYILNELGIENIYVTGKAGSSEASENHAWNMVKLDDGKWYSIDLTWDDTAYNDKIVYYYFGATNAVFGQTHVVNTPESDVPEYFLYDIPEVSDTPCSLVALYRNGNKVGVYYGIENAFAHMDSASDEYTVELFEDTQIFAIGNKTPAVENLTIKGYHNEENGSCAEIFVVGDALNIGGNITFENIKLTYDSSVAIPSYIDAGENKIVFSGNKTQCEINIKGSDSCVLEILSKKAELKNVELKNILLATKSVDFGGANCTAQNVTVKDGITDIETEMLSKFSKAKTVYIPSTVTFISSRAFDSNMLLENINVDLKNTAYKSVDGVLYAMSKSGLKLVRCPVNKDETTLITENAISVETNAFKSVNNINKIVLKYGCEAIGENAFAQISSYVNVYIPSSVNNVAPTAFDNSNNLTVYCKNESYVSKIDTVDKKFIEEYTYKFYDYDDNILYEVTDYENSLINKPDDPKRDSDSMYEYAFAEWENYTDGMLLIDNCEFKANYNQTLRKYMVKFLDANNKEIPNVGGIVDAGSNVILPTNNPTKDSTDEFEYIFTGWSGYEPDENGEMKVLDNITFTPDFEEKKRSYTYTFLDEDGETVLSDGTLEYGSIIPLPSEPSKDHFVFESWLGYTENLTIKNDITFTASYEPQVYEYIFYDEDGETVLAKGELTYSSVIPLPNSPESKVREDGKVYIFAGWTGFEHGMQISENVYFVAEYKANAFKYRFLSYDSETVIKEGILEYGEIIPTPSDIPIRESTAKYDYVFKGWKGYEQDMTISDNTDFVADYTEIVRNYECKFIDENGKTLKFEKLPYGTLIVPPEYSVDDVPGYICEFVGWDGYTDGMTLEQNRIFTAKVKKTPLTCKVTFKNYDGSVFKQITVQSGSVINLPTSNPTKKGYVFNGWKGYTQGMTTSEDIEFVAVFELSEKTIISSVYKISDGIIYGVNYNTTLVQFKNNLDNEFIVKIYDKTGKEIISDEALVTTFSKIKLYSDKEDVLQELEIAVKGDINGDGKVTVTDFVKIKAQLIDDNYLTGKAEKKAADFNDDGKISITDFVKIKTVCLNNR